MLYQPPQRGMKNEKRNQGPSSPLFSSTRGGRNPAYTISDGALLSISRISLAYNSRISQNYNLERDIAEDRRRMISHCLPTSANSEVK